MIYSEGFVFAGRSQSLLYLTKEYRKMHSVKEDVVVPGDKVVKLPIDGWSLFYTED
jgi:hypothetical protein